MLLFLDLGPPGKTQKLNRLILGLGVLAFAIVPDVTVGQVPNNNSGFSLALPKANPSAGNAAVFESVARPQVQEIDPNTANEPISRVQGGLPAELILPTQ